MDIPATSSKSTNNAGPTVVVAPEISFERINAALRQLGWTRQPDTAELPSLIPGEPEFATWRHSSGHALLTYSFQPVVLLRSLSFSGASSAARAAEAEDALETLDGYRVVCLLRSTDTGDKLLGILATAELRAVLLYAEVRALADDPDSRVSGAAGRTLAILREELLKQADGVSFDSARPGSPQSRRQALRRWAASGMPHLDEAAVVLGRALADPDWEVRAGAIVFAARAGATSLARSIRDVALPDGPSAGVHRLDARILRAAQRSALKMLDPRLRPELRFSDPRTSQIDRCVAGEPPERVDRIYWLITALTTARAPYAPPANVAAGLELRGDCYHAASLGLDFVWIPPVAHWVGGPDPDSDAATLDRALSPGFFFAREASPELLDAAEAGALAERLRRRSDLPLRIVGAEEWEMAVWGADARLFPWGNGDEKLRAPWTGPWGAQLTDAFEWTVSSRQRALEPSRGPARPRSTRPPSASASAPAQAAVRLMLDG